MRNFAHFLSGSFTVLCVPQTDFQLIPHRSYRASAATDCHLVAVHPTPGCGSRLFLGWEIEGIAGLFVVARKILTSFTLPHFDSIIIHHSLLDIPRLPRCCCCCFSKHRSHCFIYSAVYLFQLSRHIALTPSTLKRTASSSLHEYRNPVRKASCRA
jgi:hypothetical protein